MDRRGIDRREALIGVGGGVAGLALGIGVSGRSSRRPPSEPAPASAAEARGRLEAGNERFVNGKPRHGHESRTWRAALREDQHPFAAILGCSDSRVPVELVFDQGLGDLFTIRVAGNVIATDVLGSIGYAVRHLRVPLFVVLGHEGCGAVAAAVAARSGKAKEPRGIEALIRHIEPGLGPLGPAGSPAAQLKAAVEANVRWSMKQLAELPEGKRALREKTIEMVGAVYELETGRVRFLG